MNRPKISIKQKKFTRNGSSIKFKKQPREYNPTKDLLNEQLIARAIWECLKENNPDGVIEILEAHFNAIKKARLQKNIICLGQLFIMHSKARIPRSIL